MIRIEGGKARAIVWREVEEAGVPNEAGHIDNVARQLRDKGVLRIRSRPKGRGFVAVLAHAASF